MATKKKGTEEKQEMIPRLVARVPKDEAEEAEGLGNAAQMAVDAVNEELERLDALVKATEKEITGRTTTAIIFKAVTLLGGLGVLTGRVPGLDQWIGALIVVVAGADLLFANYKRLRSKVAQLDATEELIDAVADATGVSISVMRLAGQRPPRGGALVALRLYADFWQDLQHRLSQGHRAVRGAARKLELDLVKRLDVSQTTKDAADESEAKGPDAGDDRKRISDQGTPPPPQDSDAEGDKGKPGKKRGA